MLSALDAAREALRSNPAAQPEEAQGGGASAEATQIGDSADERSGVRDGQAPASNADALVLMSETLLATGPAQRKGGESHQVVVHVDAATLADDKDGSCELDDGSPLHPETARRLACDASVLRILERDGRPLSIGRKTRTISPALRRALRSRDRTCRFPGRCQRRFLHAHHVDHWARGGRTDLSNLVHLCSYHHRLLHEGGYSVERRSGGALRFRRPDGRALPARPEAARGDRDELPRRHRKRGLVVTEATCVPRYYGDRLELPLVVDGLVERDPRFVEAPAVVSGAASAAEGDRLPTA